MATFKTSGIIIKKSQINEKQEMCVVFTKEFGKISVFSKIAKKEKMLDIGTILNFEAHVKNEKFATDMKNISILHQFQYQNRGYEEIFGFMELLKILYDDCPAGIENSEIYEIFLQLKKYDPLTKEKIIFAKLKLYDILGFLGNKVFDVKIQKICTFIAQNSPPNALKLTGLSPELYKTFEVFFENIKK